MSRTLALLSIAAYIPLGVVAGLFVGTTIGTATRTDVWREAARFEEP